MSRNIYRQAGENTKDIDQSLKLIAAQITNLANRIKANKEVINDQMLDGYRESIFNLSKTVAKVNYEYKETTESIASMITSHQTNEMTTVKSVKDIITKRIYEKTKLYDATKDPEVVKIRRILKLGNDNDIEGEFEVVDEEGLNERSIICPYTQSRFVEPMKNTGGCIHRVSKEALRVMCKNGPGRCPVFGCTKNWDIKTATLDTEFIKQIEEYDRSKALTQIIDHYYTQF